MCWREELIELIKNFALRFISELVSKGLFGLLDFLFIASFYNRLLMDLIF